MDMDLVDYLQHCRESRPSRRPDDDTPVADDLVDEAWDKRPYARSQACKLDLAAMTGSAVEKARSLVFDKITPSFDGLESSTRNN